MAIGFTSLFGAMFSKTYRVYVVFRDYQLKSKVRKQMSKPLLRIQVHGEKKQTLCNGLSTSVSKYTKNKINKSVNKVNRSQNTERDQILRNII